MEKKPERDPLDPDLALGVESLDSYHRRFCAVLDEIADAAREGHADAAAIDALEMIKNNAQRHFDEEEAFMREQGYPGLDKHSEEHARFWDDEFAPVERTLETAGPSFSLVRQVDQVVRRWIRNHINSVDRELADWLRERGASGSLDQA